MKKTIKTLGFGLVLVLALATAGCSRKKEANEAHDLESVRASLRERVARGELTKEEAIVQLAEARAKFGPGEKHEAKLSPALEAYGDELKERVAKGELTAEEAMSAWMEAAEKAKSSAKAANDSVKEKE
jgi:uncharacterized membrane protein